MTGHEGESRRNTPIPDSPIRKILQPFERFLRIEASSGILLVAAAAAALIWANVPGGDLSYDHFWHTDIGFAFGSREFSMPLSHWINDSLMAIFFFVVGLEIKREILVGELRTLRSALLPVAAAVGGMAVPGIIYLMLNSTGPAAEGWGIPMATDIAFAIGAMALLGSRVPVGLKVFITALAIVDDLGAVLVIAIFYSNGLNAVALAAAGGILAVMFLLNALGVRAVGAYLVLGVLLWFALLSSGLHATLAGVLASLAIPARRRINAGYFVASVRSNLKEVEQLDPGSEPMVPGAAQQRALDGIGAALEATQSPMARLERSLHPWVMFGIMPVFALANAGVKLVGVETGMADTTPIALFVRPVSLGVLLGLFVGKPLGIVLFSWIAFRTGKVSMPDGVRFFHIVGAGSLAGIGFTMSMFISDIALPDGPLLIEAKLGFLAASLLSGIAGSALLVAASRRAKSY